MIVVAEWHFWCDRGSAPPIGKAVKYAVPGSRVPSEGGNLTRYPVILYDAVVMNSKLANKFG